MSSFVFSRLLLGAFVAVLTPALLHADDLTQRVDRAIERGRVALLSKLAPLVEEPRQDYPVGRICFVLTALLKAGTSSTQPEIAHAFDRVSELKSEKTYDVSCHVFALDALLDRLGVERRAVAHAAMARTESEETSQSEQVPDSEDLRKRMKELVGLLVASQSQRRGSWTYGHDPTTTRHDFSNTQFAVLALGAGLEHGVEVPAKVFVKLARLFAESIALEPDRFTLTYQPSARLEEILGVSSPPPARRLRLRPGGWAYRAVSKLKRSSTKRKRPYASMTAAGASSLLVALKALRYRMGAPGAKSRAWRRTAQEAERALHQAYAWIAKHFDEFLGNRKKLYYSLYSLEKVGDLSGVAKFGDRDWYREGCERILDEQKRNGSWGSYVNTAFSLLFLTRATRALNPTATPIIYTGKASDNAKTMTADLVYLKSADGFVSATAVLEYLATSRDPKLIRAGKEVIRNYVLNKGDLAGPLLGVWAKPDRATTFARKALRRLTGLTSSRKSDYVSWYGNYRVVRTLERRPTVSADEVARWLAKVRSPLLKTHLVRLATKHRHYRLCSLLIDELKVESEPYRRLVHATLGLWTRAEIEAPLKANQRGWRATRRAWRLWWTNVADERWGRH